MNTSIKIRKRIEVKGIVQGVGFRPFIYKLAHKFELSGFVSNNNEGVEIEVEGDPESIEIFINSISTEAPPLSQVNQINQSDLETENSTKFIIKKSAIASGNKTLISPDVSICEDCKSELFNKDDRRYLYPFINCTNCGPRFTIIENIPYDRKYTTMKIFEMCNDCKNEYEDPLNRRFHAQPNACPNCGPTVWIEEKNNTVNEDQPIENLIDYLLDGKIAAIKGLGGFHLAVDANNELAVSRLRGRKNREAKPLAIMAADLETVHSLVYCGDNEEKILTGIERPILLLKKKKDNKIAQNIAPGNSRLGIMLPYTPLHYVLFNNLSERIEDENIPALVMTSANLSEEPIAISNSEAKEKLDKIADVFLMHNREILIRADDSVLINVNDKHRIIRRSRGFVPKGVKLLNEAPPIMGLGAELKNTICLTKDDNAFISQHIGDLTNLKAFNFFSETINHLQKIMDTKAEYYAIDMHPDYLSSKWAEKKNGHKSFSIQHHHAHMASCMIEHGLDEKVIGIILDGTGFGYDSTIWGGEILIGDYTEIKRFKHLEQFPLPGGDAAAKEPWRVALSYLYHTFNGRLPQNELFENLPVNQVSQLLEKKLNSPLTSSMGRLFDAVSFLSGGPKKIRYEAEAAIQLTQLVSNFNSDYIEYDPILKNEKTIPLKKLIENVFNLSQSGVDRSEIANRFHSTIAKIFLESALLAKKESKITKVVLSGGVFQNEVLLTMLENELKKNNFEVYSHKNIPTNDGGISLGQVAISTKLIEHNLDSPIFIN